jgi:aryl-alcohol dehydrogenase-like predicted oxidoreductase
MLGGTGLAVSALGFGCGAVGGLMVRGNAPDQERAVARALELGINFLDTAPAYGDGESERNLGRVLRTLRPDVVLATKFRVPVDRRAHVAQTVTSSLEESLRRLGRERLDLLQLHNPISVDGTGNTLDANAVLDQVVPALEGLRQQGKIGFAGITALGETPSLHRVIDARAVHTAQVCYNLLNPSAGTALPAGFPAQDFGRLLDRTRTAGMGAIVIRVLAGGALSGMEARHPLGLPAVEPIASGRDYRTDVHRARELEALVREGHAASMVEASLRFALASDAVSTVLVGYSTLEQLEYAAAAVNRGPLTRAALERLSALWHGLAAR